MSLHNAVIVTAQCGLINQRSSVPQSLSLSVWPCPTFRSISINCSAVAEPCAPLCDVKSVYKALHFFFTQSAESSVIRESYRLSAMAPSPASHINPLEWQALQRNAPFDSMVRGGENLNPDLYFVIWV